jgi:hypothetical protein
MADFAVEHERVCLDPEARNLRHTYVTVSEDRKTWRVQQVIVDSQGFNDWIVELSVDLAKSREVNEPCLVLVRVGPLAR